MNIKFLSIIGTRPQFIKVIDNLPNHVICNTGQHYDYEMNDIFVKQLKVRPKYNLKATNLGNMIDKATEVINKEKPNIVLIYGDTRSTLAGALAAKFAGKTLAHVESGMRSYDMTQPEEIIRIIVDNISDYRFCANNYAKQNLYDEGIYKNVFVVGDPMWDALQSILPVKKTKDCGQYNVLTIHRQQTVEDKNKLKEIFEALKESEERFIFPVHPRTKRNIKKFKLKVPKNIEMIKPLSHKEMIKLLVNCKKILTDSGGLTREAYWFSKPVIILRWETEWKEIIEDNWGILVGHKKNLILEALKNHSPSLAKNRPRFVPDYGAKEKIREILLG